VLQFKMCYEENPPIDLAGMSVPEKGFGCRPLERRRRVFGGRRPKASKEETARGNVRRCRVADLSPARTRATLRWSHESLKGINVSQTFIKEIKRSVVVDDPTA